MENGMGLGMSEEFATLDFNSSRLEKRFIRTMETLAGQPDKSIWFCSKNRAEAKAAYRLLSNDKLDREEILRAHQESTVGRMIQSERTILAVQDTTSLNYNTQTKMEGIGYISDKTLGVNIHSCLAVTVDGLVLGVLAQSSYNREQPKDTARTHDSKKVRELEEKESFRWVQTLGESTIDVPETVHVVTVCDREGDMYELFDKADSEGQAFLIRIVQNRKTVENGKILDEIREKPCMGKIQTTIPRDSRRGIKEREAVLQIRYCSFAIQRPQILNKVKHLKAAQKVNVVYVLEEQQEEAIEPVEW
ncbi:MAG: IS4 family transposase, partial [Treponema sp.]|nr:IS4 family transposase [Treponema sp.]